MRVINIAKVLQRDIKCRVKLFSRMIVSAIKSRYRVDRNNPDK